MTGERVLLVTETDTVALEGIERERAIELAEALFEVLYRPEALYRHRWHRGDLVIWDNLALQHARGSCAEVGVRTLQLVASQPKPLTELDRRMDLDDPAVKAYYDREFTDTGGDPAP